ncbi:hypothetical protein [Streptacidiphilus rugosus]|uniref:hypothetical protein n=1 Tax=Streptacidiphilus rugosus TaxID=405783 RepID=UPI000561024F|nr:hypothetical protein [Streptacidiphilus rugosus]
MTTARAATGGNDIFGELLPGEQVRWEAQPGPGRRRAAWNLAPLLGASVGVPVLAVLTMRDIVGGGQSVPVRLVWGLALCAGAAQWLWYLAGAFRDRSRFTVVRYRLTSDRLVIVRGEGSRAVAEAWWVWDLREPRLVERRGKHGHDLVVHAAAGPDAPTVRLEALPDAAAVRELLLSGRAEAAHGPRPEGARPEDLRVAPGEGLPQGVRLDPDERLLWAARARTAWWYTGADRLNSAVGALTVAVAVLLSVGLSSNGSYPSGPGLPVLLLGVVLGGYAAVGRLFRRRYRARRSSYGLTDRHLLTVVAGARGAEPTVHRLPLADLRPPFVRDGLVMSDVKGLPTQGRPSTGPWPFTAWSAGARRLVNWVALAVPEEPEAVARLIALAQRAAR